MTSTRRLSKAEQDLLELIRRFEEETGQKYDPNSSFTGVPMPGPMGAPGMRNPPFELQELISQFEEVTGKGEAPKGFGSRQRAIDERMGVTPTPPDEGFAQSEAYQARTAKSQEFYEENIRPVTSGLVGGIETAGTAVIGGLAHIGETQTAADELAGRSLLPPDERTEELADKLVSSNELFAEAFDVYRKTYGSTEGGRGDKMQAASAATRDLYPDIPDWVWTAGEMFAEELALLRLTGIGSLAGLGVKGLSLAALKLQKIDIERLRSLGNLAEAAKIPLSVIEVVGTAPIKFENWLGEMILKGAGEVTGAVARGVGRVVTDAPGGPKALDTTFVDDTIQADDFLEPEPLVIDRDAQAELDEIERRLLNLDAEETIGEAFDEDNFFTLEQERERLIDVGDVVSGMDDEMVERAWEIARRGGRKGVQEELRELELIIEDEIDKGADEALEQRLLGQREDLLDLGGISTRPDDYFPQITPPEMPSIPPSEYMLAQSELRAQALADRFAAAGGRLYGKEAFRETIGKELEELQDELEELDSLQARGYPVSDEMSNLSNRIARIQISAEWIDDLPDAYVNKLGLVYVDNIAGASRGSMIAGQYSRTDVFEPALVTISRRLAGGTTGSDIVIIHEVVHHLEQFIPLDDSRRLFSQWQRELGSSGQNVIDEANELRIEGSSSLLSAQEIDKINKAYRYEAGFREWIAEVITDRALRDIYMEIPEYKNIIQKILDVIKNMAAATRNLLMGSDPDYAERVYRNLISGNYSEADRRFVLDDFELFKGVPDPEDYDARSILYDPDSGDMLDDPDAALLNELFAEDIRPGSKRLLADGQEVRVEETKTDPDTGILIASVVNLDKNGKKVRNQKPRWMEVDDLLEAEDVTDLVPATIAKGIIGIVNGRRVVITHVSGNKISIAAVTKNGTLVEGPKKFSDVVDESEFDEVSEIIGTREEPATPITTAKEGGLKASLVPRYSFELQKNNLKRGFVLGLDGKRMGKSMPMEEAEKKVVELNAQLDVEKVVPADTTPTPGAAGAPKPTRAPDERTLTELYDEIELNEGLEARKLVQGFHRKGVNTMESHAEADTISTRFVELTAENRTILESLGGIVQVEPQVTFEPGVFDTYVQFNKSALTPQGINKIIRSLQRQGDAITEPFAFDDVPTVAAPTVVAPEAPVVSKPAASKTTKGRKIPGGKGAATKYAAGYIEYNYQGISGVIQRSQGDTWSISIPSIQGDAAAAALPGRGGRFATSRRDAITQFDQMVDAFKAAEVARNVPSSTGIRRLSGATKTRNINKETIIDAKYTDGDGNPVDIQMQKNTAFPDSPSHNTWDVNITRGEQTSTTNLGKFGSEKLAKEDLERLLDEIPRYVEGAPAPTLTNKTDSGPARWIAKTAEESEWQLPTRVDEAIPETPTATSAKPVTPVTPGLTVRKVTRGSFRGKWVVEDANNKRIGRRHANEAAATKARDAENAKAAVSTEAPPVATPVVDAPVTEVAEESPGLVQAREDMPKETTASPSTGKPALRKSKTPDGEELPRYEGVADVPIAVRPVKTPRGFALWDIEKKARMPGVTRDLQGILEKANLENEARFQKAKEEITPEPVIENEPTKLKNRHKRRPATPEPKIPSPSGEDILNIDDAAGFIAKVTDSTLPGQRFDQTALGLTEAAIGAGQRQGQRIVNAGNETLLAHGIGVRRGLSVIARDEDKIVLDELYNALHNPSKVESGEIVVPENLREIYDELRDVTDWEERNRISFDPEMALHDDYFARGWKPPEGAFINSPSGRLIRNPNFKKHRVDATYAEMRELGYEPAYWNPYEQFRASFLEAARDRQQRELMHAITQQADEDMIRAVLPGATPDGWRTPKVGPIFEGSGKPGDNGFIVPNGIANTLEAIYGVKPKLVPTSFNNRSFDIAKYLDWISFVPKKFKLFASFFQQRDFLLRSGVGAFHGFVDGLMRGDPVDALGSLIKYPRSVQRMLHANISPGKRRNLLDLLDNEDVIITERPGITLKSISAGGLSTRDVSILPPDTTDLLKEEIQKRGLSRMRAVIDGLKGIDDAMRRGLFEGVYPAAIIEDIRNTIVPAIVHRYGDKLTDAQLSRKIAMTANVKYSTIPRSQAFIQHNVIYDIMTRLFFSMGESEGLLKQASGAFGGKYSYMGGKDAGFWREHWLAAYLTVMSSAAVIHFASTGEHLPKDRFIPIAKTGKWGVPIPETIPGTGITIPGGGQHYGYNVDFASPNIPWAGRSGTQLTLDIVGQMDTGFRVLDPGSFATSRFNVGPRSLMNQLKGTSFSGDDITDLGETGVGPGAVWTRTIQAVIDMFAPIGAGTSAFGVAKETFPVLDEWIADQEPRLGTTGQILQVTGENIRTRSTEKLIIENLTELGFTTPEGEPLTSYDDISVFHMKQLEQQSPRVFAELQIRDEEAAAKGSEGAIRRISGRAINEERMSKENALVAKLEDGRLSGDTRLEQMTSFAELYTQTQRTAMDKRAQLYEELNFKEPREITDPYKKALDNYYKTYEEATDASGELDFDKLEELQAELQGTVTPLQWAYIEENSGLTEHPLVIQYYLEDRKLVSDSGYWDVPEDLRTAFREQNPDVDVALVYWRGYEPKTGQGEMALMQLVD